MEASLIFSIAKPLIAIVKPIVTFLPSVWNLICRPRISISLESRLFQFKLEDGKTHIYEIPYFVVHNRGKTEIKIKANAIWINNDSYSCSMQSDNIFLTHYHPDAKKQPPEVDASFVYKFYRDHWFYIAQGVKFLIIPPNEKMLFPFKLIGARLTLLNASKRNSKLFFNKKKISFTANIDGRVCEYGLSRAACSAVYINYLASHTSRYDHQKCL